MQFLISEFRPGEFPIGTEIDCHITRYTEQDGKAVVILSGVHVQGGKTVPYDLQYNISRTNGELLSLIYNTRDKGISALTDVPARLIVLSYTTVGFNGKRYENRSWLFQPMDSIIKSGDDWYLTGI